jgi:MoaA/NifB/PqqE/SkfB family radical SAM enzyme
MIGALRLARAGARVAGAHVSRLQTPLKLNWCLTYWCQYRCLTCNIWKRKPEDELTTGEIQDVIRHCPSPSWLDLTGGELFLRQDIGAVMESIVAGWRSLAVLHFPTNGFLTDRIVDVTRSIASRVPTFIVTVSLDGDEALNDRIRGIKGGYRRQIETFRRLRELRGVKTVFGMTLSALNAGRFEETFAAVSRECPGLDIGDFHLNVAQTSDHYYGNNEAADILPGKATVRSELARYAALKGAPRSVADWVEQRYLRHLDSYLETGQTPLPCHALRSSAFIDPWGTVYPCITWARPLGSLRNNGYRLLDIWRSRETTSVQHEIWKSRCPQCWTACEAYQTILGHALVSPLRVVRPSSRGPVEQPSGVR